MPELPDQVFNPESLSEEELDKVDELRHNFNQGMAVKSMAESDGWKRYIYPLIQRRVKSLQQQLLSESEHVKMIMLQQGINAMLNMDLLIKNCIALGDQAAEKLKSVNPDAEG